MDAVPDTRWVTGALGLAVLIAAMNLAGYAAMARDKRCAERGLWRWPERRLLGIAFWGGSLGTLLAQRRLRHKTRKQPFARRLAAILGLHGLLVLALAFGLAASPPLRGQAAQTLAAASATAAWVVDALRLTQTSGPGAGQPVEIIRGL